MTLAMFCEWVNTHLLPESELPPGFPKEIHDCNGRKWLNHLGFHPQSYKKGIYIDGHEGSDVVEYLKMYLRKIDILSSTHLPPLSCSDGRSFVEIVNFEASKHLVLIYHDESSFHANRGQSVMWVEEGRVPIRRVAKAWLDGKRFRYRTRWLASTNR